MSRNSAFHDVGRVFNGTGLPWNLKYESEYNRSGPILFEKDVDNIGVSDSLEYFTSFTTPSHGFRFEDTDGVLILEFNSVSTVDYKEIEISFDMLVAQNSPLLLDFFRYILKNDSIWVTQLW